MQAVSSYRVNPVYWLLLVNSVYWLYWFNLVIFERRYPLALLLISLTGLSYPCSSSLGYSVRRSLLWAYSLFSSLWSTLCRTLWPISSPLPFPLVYRRYRYAIRLTRNGDSFV